MMSVTKCIANVAVTALAAGFLAVSAAPSHAVVMMVGTQDCSNASPDATGKFSPTTDCELFDPLRTSNSQPMLTEINNAGFFGMSDYSIEGLIEFDNEANTVSKQEGDLTVSTVSGSDIDEMGTFKVSNIDTRMKYFLGVKGGNADPDNFVAYLLDTSGAVGGMLTGSYMTPFCNGTDDPCTNLKEISNIRLYKSATVIPVPAPVALLLTAIAGLGFLGWRRSTAVAV